MHTAIVAQDLQTGDQIICSLYMPVLAVCETLTVSGTPKLTSGGVVVPCNHDGRFSTITIPSDDLVGVYRN